jgi:hypothetical protein
VQSDIGRFRSRIQPVVDAAAEDKRERPLRVGLSRLQSDQLTDAEDQFN